MRVHKKFAGSSNPAPLRGGVFRPRLSVSLERIEKLERTEKKDSE